MGSKQCVGCLAAFSNPPSNAKENGEAKRDSEAKVAKKDDDDSEEQKASESGRYECRACESHFCIDCDMFAHMVLHNCPGCLGRLDPNAAATSNGDVEMSG